MTQLLVRMFVKNYEKTEDERVRTAYGVLGSVVGIICNVLLFVAKVLVGVLMGSVAVVADAFNNLSDAFSSIISFVGVKMASRPADKEHPFGHGRYEYIAAFVVAFLIIQVGFSFVKSAFDKILHPEAMVFSIISVLILVLSVGVKLWLVVFNRRLGRKINSSMMIATATDAFGDMLATSATIISILVYHFFDVNIDGVVGVLVALVVLWAGIGVARDTIRPLLGGAVPVEIYDLLKRKVESYEGIEGVHDMIIHSYGPTKSMATLHAEVPSNVDIETSHELIDRIEREITKETGIFLVIHMDPVVMDDCFVCEWRDKVRDIVSALDEQVTIHDFRLVNGKEQINLIFDIVVPFSYNNDKAQAFVSSIEKMVHIVDGRCQCVITVDRSFIGE